MKQTFDSGPITIIINKGARSSQDLDDDSIRKAFATHGRQVQVQSVDGGEIADAVRTSLDNGSRIVVAAGGDGTVNAVAAELVGREDAALAVLPVGTLNHFARDIGMPGELEEAVAVIASGYARQVDVGEVNGQIFLNNSSLGLYARMVVERERLQHDWNLGKLSAMIRAGWSVLRHAHTFSVVLHADGRELRRQTPFVFIGNNDYEIEGLGAGERSCLDEGMLAIYVLRPSTPWGLVKLAISAMAGRLVHGRDIEKLQATSLVVESHHAHADVARDGEVDTLDTPLRYEIRARALRVIAPMAKAT